MKLVCKYAIVQFLPYIETGEFANVGVLVFVPKTGFVDYKLAPVRFKRVTHFFDELDAEVYGAAVKMFNKELMQVTETAYQLKGERFIDFIAEVTRYRESLLRFSEIRTIVSDDFEGLAEKLYERLVGRDFLTKEYREQTMVKAIRRQLHTKKVPVN